MRLESLNPYPAAQFQDSFGAEFFSPEPAAKKRYIYNYKDTSRDLLSYELKSLKRGCTFFTSTILPHVFAELSQFSCTSGSIHKCTTLVVGHIPQGMETNTTYPSRIYPFPVVLFCTPACHLKHSASLSHYSETKAMSDHYLQFVCLPMEGKR